MSLFSPSKPHHLGTVLALAAAATLLGAWELAVTRLASVVYFFDLTYLALAVCLFRVGRRGTLDQAIRQSATPVRPVGVAAHVDANQLVVDLEV